MFQTHNQIHALEEMWGLGGCFQLSMWPASVHIHPSTFWAFSDWIEAAQQLIDLPLGFTTSKAKNRCLQHVAAFTLPDLDSFPGVNTYPGRVPVRATCGRGHGQSKRWLSCVLNSIIQRVCVSVLSSGLTSVRSQRATRGLRATERPPLSRVRTAHVAGCTAPALIQSLLQQCCPKPPSFILGCCSRSSSPPTHTPPSPCSQKRASTMLLEAWSGFFSTPVDRAHVDNIHRVSVN